MSYVFTLPREFNLKKKISMWFDFTDSKLLYSICAAPSVGDSSGFMPAAPEKPAKTQHTCLESNTTPITRFQGWTLFHRFADSGLISRFYTSNPFQKSVITSHSNISRF